MEQGYEEVPFDYCIQSPIGLVPKDNGSDVKLIFHLSYPKRHDSASVNANTLHELCTVQYIDFDEAVRLCLSYVTEEHRPIYVAKLDAQSAFHILGLSRCSWPWTVLKAISPHDGKMYYFIDKCLPFGSSISCALFQKVADAVKFLVQFRTKVVLINYLDDFLFISSFKWACNQQLQVFLAISKEINFPISDEKTFEATTQLPFLGMLLDGERHLFLILVAKLVKANLLITEILQPGKRKITVLKLQQICGFLNFLC